MSDEPLKKTATQLNEERMSDSFPSHEVAKVDMKPLIVDTLVGLEALARMEDIPDRVEFRAPADADFGSARNAESFIEKVNELKHELGAKGFHCRISQETVVENVWLFRYLPSKALLDRKAIEADNHLRKCIDAGLAGKPLPPLLIPDDIDKPVNTKPGYELPIPPEIAWRPEDPIDRSEEARRVLREGDRISKADPPRVPLVSKRKREPWVVDVDYSGTPSRSIRGGTTDQLWVDAPPPSLWERFKDWVAR